MDNRALSAPCTCPNQDTIVGNCPRHGDIWRFSLEPVHPDDLIRLGPVLRAVAAEMRRQDIKHGHFEGTTLGRSRLALACLRDELDEAEAAWRDERKADDWTHTREEVLQVAAVALRALRDTL